MARALKLAGTCRRPTSSTSPTTDGASPASTGKAVFIEGALPGERVRYRVFKRRRQMDEAGLVEVLTASPDRVTPRCAHFGICGGCSLAASGADGAVAAKQRHCSTTSNASAA